MKTVKDALYGFVKINEKFIKIIDHEEFQRLREIKQLGFTTLVYPSANHTRFEHSIGSFYLAEKMCLHFEEFNEEFLTAALLHDIGHIPFSHSIEELFRKHEEISVEIVKNHFQEILEKSGIEVKKVCKMIKGKTKFGKLISGEIDVDRLDYLRRDSYYTGVAYGVIDSDAVIRGIEKIGKHIRIKSDYLPAVESLLIGRYLMYASVYMHHTVRCINAMLRRSCQELLRAVEKSDIKKFERLKDFEMMNVLLKNKKSKEIFEKILKRKIYKEICRIFLTTKRHFSLWEIYEIENNISSELGMKNGEIILHIPRIRKFSESNIIISEFGKTLEKVSPLVKSLNKALENHLWIGICSSKTLSKEKVKRIAEKYLG